LLKKNIVYLSTRLFCINEFWIFKFDAHPSLHRSSRLGSSNFKVSKPFIHIHTRFYMKI
jgi:hypothetical protein